MRRKILAERPAQRRLRGVTPHGFLLAALMRKPCILGQRDCPAQSSPGRPEGLLKIGKGNFPFASIKASLVSRFKSQAVDQLQRLEILC